MREDMPRVITERARVGHDRRYHEVRHQSSRCGRKYEELPAHEGMRRPFRQLKISKQFSEHLSPLRRFLEKRVGQPWDAVYAEICKGLRVNSALHAHVRDHVRDFVETNIYILADGTYARNAGGRAFPITEGGRWRHLIVCPQSGLLLRVDDLPQVRHHKAEQQAKEAAKEAAEAAANPPPIRLDQETDLRRINGIWYLVAYAVLPEPCPMRVKAIEPGDADPDPAEIRKAGYWLENLGEGRRAVMRLAEFPRFDVLIGQHIRRGDMAPIRGVVTKSWYTPKAPATHYAASKRQAPHAILLKYGLRNGETP